VKAPLPGIVSAPRSATHEIPHKLCNVGPNRAALVIRSERFTVDNINETDRHCAKAKHSRADGCFVVSRTVYFAIVTSGPSLNAPIVRRRTRPGIDRRGAAAQSVQRYCRASSCQLDRGALTTRAPIDVDPALDSSVDRTMLPATPVRCHVRIAEHASQDHEGDPVHLNDSSFYSFS